MRIKSRFLGARLEPHQQRKLVAVSHMAGEPGNMSAALRWLLDQVDLSQQTQATTRDAGYGLGAEPGVSH
jgi:hypothetical protein